MLHQQVDSLKIAIAITCTAMIPPSFHIFSMALDMTLHRSDKPDLNKHCKHWAAGSIRHQI